MNKLFHLQLSSSEKYPYRVVSSNRAKYIRIKLTNNGELSVILPKRSLVRHAHEFVKSKSEWIKKHLDAITIDSSTFHPESLELVLLSETWLINYVQTQSESVNTKEKPNYRLEVYGNVEESDLVRRAINLWCRKKARPIFSSMLESTAEKYGFHYNRLSIRSQKTRWGSCSNKKNINLNSKLLLMPIDVVQYVMIHELCHTVEMNHSVQFWNLVEECDVDFQKNRKKLKVLGRDIHL